MKITENISELLAVRKYEPPKYPTFDDAWNDSSLLKKIPSRWAKNMGAIACLGLLGVTTLLGQGCFFRCPRCGGMHFGGSGVPIYVVHLTEQEAIGVIRDKAEYMGLDLRAPTPDLSVTVQGATVGLDLIDEENNVAVAHIGDTTWWGNSHFIARDAQEAFDAKDDDLTVGVFYSHVAPTRCTPTAEERASAIDRLKEHLSAQVREFIEWLQAEGIIQ